MSDFETAREFAQFIKGLGFRAFVATVPGGEGRRGYGCISDATGTRVLSFQFSDGGSLGGNYQGGRKCGTGWRMDESPYDMRSAEDVRKALYSLAPNWTGFNASERRCHTCGSVTGEARSGGTYTTLEQYLGFYQASSKFEEI